MSDRMLVATRKGLLTFGHGNGGWTIAGVAFAGSSVTATLRDPYDGAVYAALNLGHFGPKLHRSDDDGRTWQELPAPAFPPDTPGAPSVFQIWTLESGGPLRAGRLWAGCIPAGLFRSDDRGASWQLVRSLWDVPERARWFGGGYDDAGIHTILPDLRSPDRVFVAISCGGVWDSDDGGSTWHLRGHGLIAAYMPPEKADDLEIQDPHRVARCDAAPEVMWMQHHNGVFRSTDGGHRWARLSPPVAEFGFAVAAHPSKPDTAWLVPAIADEKRMPAAGAMCVTRTQDGGRTWNVLREGLPQRDAYDLIYRHGLDADASGTRLAMGSTTGSLWVSETGGEHWQLVNGHLPPIYAVRFI